MPLDSEEFETTNKDDLKWNQPGDLTVLINKPTNNCKMSMKNPEKVLNEALGKAVNN